MFSFQKVIDEYRDVVKNEKRIAYTGDISIEDIFSKIKDSNTSFGKPRLSDVSFVKGDSIVIGPNRWGDYLIVYKNKTDLCVSVQQEVVFIKDYNKDNNSELDSEESYFDNPGKWFENMFRSIDIYSLYEKVSAFVESYIKDGNAEYENYIYKAGEFFRLNENIDTDSRNYLLTDIDDNIVYDILEKLPSGSFVIYDHLTGDEMLNVERKWNTFLCRYEFNKNDNLYGIFEKESVLSTRFFIMSSIDGEISMRQCKSKAGTYYLVKIKDDIVGIIVNHIVSDVGEPELDTCVIQVKNRKYRPQITALATMIVNNGNLNE